MRQERGVKWVAEWQSNEWKNEHEGEKRRCRRSENLSAFSAELKFSLSLCLSQNLVDCDYRQWIGMFVEQ